MDLPGLDPRLARRGHAGADWLQAQRAAGRTVTVVHHIDADGVTAGAIALQTLARLGIPARSVPAKSLDDVHVDRIRQGGHEALWFCDFGSTAYMHFDAPRLVCDHHQLVRDGTEEDFPHVNPLLDGIGGDTISGAGCAFLVALAASPQNLDLVPMALVGAAGDLQDRKPPGGSGLPAFHGANAAFQAAGIDAGLLEANVDLAWFGPETRSLRKFLSYGEPHVPGLDGRGAEALLSDLGVPLLEGTRERTWADLDDGEKQRVRDAVVQRLLDCGLPERAAAMGRTVVRLRGEPAGPTRELQEFATLLNSTARYGEPETGLAVAAGDRGEAYQHALGLLQGHRQNLVKSLDAFRHVGVQEAAGVQWAHLEDRVRDTVVGIVCGMALDGLGLRRDMPLVGLAHTDDGRTKASGRAPSEIQARIDLATAMREAAAAVGGQGGGHRGAAGATVPRAGEREFLSRLDAIVARQLGRDVPRDLAFALPAPAEGVLPIATPRAAPPAPWATAQGQTRLF